MVFPKYTGDIHIIKLLFVFLLLMCLLLQRCLSEETCSYPAIVNLCFFVNLGEKPI